MMSTNLLKLRKSLLLSQEEFALKLGIVPRAYVNYERGERKIPFEVLNILHDKYNVNLNWLITGNGEMFNGQSAQDEITTAIEKTIIKIVEEKMKGMG